MIFSMIFLTIHKISYYKVRVSTCNVETCGLRGSFLMVYRNNAGRLGSGFISVCLETRWLGPKSGLYVPERPCSRWSEGVWVERVPSKVNNRRKLDFESVNKIRNKYFN